MSETALPHAKRLAGAVLDFLLPPRCPLCKCHIDAHGHLCPACWSRLDHIAPPRCDQCGMPFVHAEDDDLLCGACLADPPAFDRALAPVQYGGKGRDLVLALKHGALYSAVPAMARMMATEIAASGLRPDTIVPVPLHRWRLLSRRFNQSQLLARDLARFTGLPLDASLLVKKRATPSQGTLGRKKRAANVRGAFSVPAQKTQQIDGRRLLLVDDVLTTGATADACARALKQAGAEAVYVAAFARVGEPVHG